LPQKDALTERLKYLTEVFRVAWVFLLATGSGTVGFWLGPRDFWRSVFAVTGVVVIVILGFVINSSQAESEASHQAGGPVIMGSVYDVIMGVSALIAILSFAVVAWYISR